MAYECDDDGVIRVTGCERNVYSPFFTRVLPLSELGVLHHNWDGALEWLGKAYEEHKMTDPRPISNGLEGKSPATKIKMLLPPKGAIGKPSSTGLSDLLRANVDKVDAMGSSIAKLMSMGKEDYQTDSEDSHSSPSASPVTKPPAGSKRKRSISNKDNDPGSTTKRVRRAPELLMCSDYSTLKPKKPTAPRTQPSKSTEQLADNQIIQNLRKELANLKTELKHQVAKAATQQAELSMSDDFRAVQSENEKLKLLILSMEQIATSLATNKDVMEKALITIRQKFKVSLD